MQQFVQLVLLPTGYCTQADAHNFFSVFFQNGLAVFLMDGSASETGVELGAEPGVEPASMKCDVPILGLIDES